jgi:tetratricopeptide (TPR) repeat protein
MRIKTLLTTASVLLFFIAIPQITWAQKDGEAQGILIDERKQQTLKFSNKGALNQRCGFFVTRTLMENDEEALAIRVAHYHHKFEVYEWNPPNYDLGSRYLPEQGWLYITPSRIVFAVEEGDPSHAFDVKRTDLKTKPVTDLARYNFAGVQINLTERLAVSNSRQQKFAFLMQGIPTCNRYVKNPKPYTNFLMRAINDFNGALSEFKQLTASLHQSGKFQLITIGATVQPRRVDKFTFAYPFDEHQLEQSTTIDKLSSEPNQSKIPLDPPNPNESKGKRGIYYALLSVRETQNGQTEQAKANAEKAVELLETPSDDAEFCAKGAAHHVLGNYDIAIANFDRAIQLDPKQWNPYLRRGETYYRKGNYDQALADYDRAIHLNSQQPNAYHDRGLALARTGDHDLAIADFDKAIELSPQEAAIYNARGAVYARKADYNRARADYNRALQLSPQLKMIYYNRGLTYAHQGDYDSALADFNKEIELNPQQADLYNARGSVYSYKGVYDRAITEYSEAIRLRPDLWMTYENRARVYETIGDTAKAQADQNRISELQKQKTKP